MYSVRLFNAQGQLIAALTRLADLQLTRRLNDAAELSFAITPTQHGAGELAMGAVCVLYAGDEPIVRARITERDFTQTPWQFRAESTAVLLKRLQTPGHWSYQGWSPEEAIEDLLTGYRVANQGSSTDWADATLHQVTPLTLGDGDEVLLLERQPNGSYHTEGYAILPVVDLGADCIAVTRLRWAQSIGQGQRLTVQVRMGNTATPGAGWTDWSTAFERIDSETGVVLQGGGYRYAQVRVNLHTNDTMAPNPDGEPQGYSPVLYATEVVGRHAGPIGKGTVPENSGLVLDETMIFDHTDHLAAIARICDAVGWQWYVDASDKLHAGPALGADLSDAVIYREGRNCRVTAFREDKSNAQNIVLGLGAGRGVGQLRVEYRHEESIAKYGERRGRYVNTAQTSKTALLSEVQEYADEHAEPLVQVSLEAGVPPDGWLHFQAGDLVRFVSEARGLNVTLPIAEEQRTLESVSLGLNTSLSAMRDLLIGLQRPKPGKGETLPPAAPVDISATPGPECIYLRWTGRADYWRIETRATEHGAWELLEAEWRSQAYAHAGQSPGEPRWYRVYAVRGGLISGPSVVVTAAADDVLPPDFGLGDLDDYRSPEQPVVPTGLAAFRAFKAFALSWGAATPPPRIERYEVQYATSPDGVTWGAWTTCGVDIRSTHYNHQAPNVTLQHKYRVRAVSLAGVEGPWSTELVAGQPGKASLSEDVVDQLARERLSQGVQTELDGLGHGLAAAEGRLDGAETRLSGAEGRLSNAETSITDLDGEIALKASQTEVDTLSGTVSDHAATLLTHATDIAARVTQTVFNVLEGRVADNEATLTAHATAIAARVTQTVFDTLEGRVASAEGTLTVHATDIAARVTKTVFDALEGRVTTTESDLLVLDDAITAAVSRITDNEAFIAAFTLTPEEISTTVSDVRPGGTLYSTIQQNAEDIALRVVKGEVISEINLSAEAARIAGKKLLLDGDTEVTGDFRVSGDAVMGTLTLDEELKIENASKSIRIHKDAMEIRNSSLVFVAETLFERADGKAITSAETRPITTDSTGSREVARPVVISSAEGVKAYKSALNVWSGTTGQPDLIYQGVVQPDGLAPFPAEKIKSGTVALARLPRQVLRTAPGASDPTVYWGKVDTLENSTHTVTFATAFKHSVVRVLAQFVDGPYGISDSTHVHNVSNTGFQVDGPTGSTGFVWPVHWVAMCASQDTGSGSCSGGCEGECQEDCQFGGCQDVCQQGLCQDACQDVCQSTCEDHCQSSCMLSCQAEPNMWV